MTNCLSDLMLVLAFLLMELALAVTAQTGMLSHCVYTRSSKGNPSMVRSSKSNGEGKSGSDCIDWIYLYGKDSMAVLIPY